jgi:ubiquinol-cytochrome c reductase cytochrome b subunit
MAAILLLALTVGAGLEAPADPGSVYEARPKWYLLFLYKLLQYFDGPAAVVATVVFPLVAFGMLMAVPLLDKGSTRPRPPKRVWGPLALLLAAVAGLSFVSLQDDADDPAFQQARMAGAREAHQAIRMAREGGINADGKVVLHEGEKLYRGKGCKSCHAADAKEKPAPLLAGYGTRGRIKRFLSNPNHPDFFGRTEFNEMMDPFIEGYGGTEDELEAVATWLYSLSGRSVEQTEQVAAGYLFFRSNCLDCHNDPALAFDHRACLGTDCDTATYRPGVEGPDLRGYQGYEWTRGLIVDARHPSFFGGVLDASTVEKTMPAYPDMSPTDLDLLTTWLVAGAPGAN